jgi:hypothetical protein
MLAYELLLRLLRSKHIHAYFQVRHNAADWFGCSRDMQQIELACEEAFKRHKTPAAVRLNVLGAVSNTVFSFAMMPLLLLMLLPRCLPRWSSRCTAWRW